MNTENVSLKLPHALLEQASHVAAAQNVTIGHLVRTLLTSEVERRLKTRQPDRMDNPETSARNAQLATELTLADGWEDLEARLCNHGYELRPDCNGLAVYRRLSGARVCNVDDLGFSYGSLVVRFECAMPGHPGDRRHIGPISPQLKQPNLPFEGDNTFEVIDFDA